MKKSLVIHPLLLAMWPILSLYSQNLEFLSPAQIWRPLLLLIGLTSILFLLIAAVLRNIAKGGAVVSLFSILFFSYAHVHRMLWGEKMQYSATDESLALMITWTVLFLGGVVIIMRIQNGWQDITRILNVMALTLVLLPLFNIGLYEIKTSNRDVRATVGPAQISRTSTVPLEDLPDIYYIILDAYGREDILLEIYDFDNSEFVDSLKQLGFFVADKSRSNYAQTDLSLSSSLNLAYLDDLSNRLSPETADRGPLEYLIQNNQVMHFLREQGYTIVGLPSGFKSTTLRSSDVHTVSATSWSDLEIRLLCNTPIPWLTVRTGLVDPYEMHRQKILTSFDLLSEPPQWPEPYFVFAHILAPHGPFVFDEQGNPVQPQQQFDLQTGMRDGERPLSQAEYRKGYVRQLTFVNNKIEPILRNLLAHASRPTIIVLQGDHGPASTLDWEHPENTNLRERFSILNAYHLPGKGSAGLYDGITPVNTFRLIFNEYLGTDLELLEDRIYFSTWDRPYQFIDVTAETEQP